MALMTETQTITTKEVYHSYKKYILNKLRSCIFYCRDFKFFVQITDFLGWQQVKNTLVELPLITSDLK